MNVELREIRKTFGTVRANDGISLSIPAGTIQGILGENGAGKSTLMKVLSGFLRPDGGSIVLDGKPAALRSPADGIRHGIGMLHQDPLDFPPMRVLDNFLAGRPGGFLPGRAAAAEQLLELERQFGFAIDPEAYVDALTVGERQQLELMRLLWLGVKVLILDEPTTGISANQRDRLFAALRLLAGHGKTIILISHKLKDVQELCGRVAVLRQGRLAGKAGPPYDADRLVELMFGQAVPPAGRSAAVRGAPSLRIQELAVEGARLRLDGVTLDVEEGAVIGLAGMEGSGQELLLRACAGLVQPVGGRIVLRDRDLTGRSYRDYLRHGLGYLPAARLEDGLVPGFTVAEHFVLADPPAGYFIDWLGGERLAGERIAEFRIRGTPSTPVESLSGGNQQRVLLALLKRPLSVLLLEHPTRGLDVESAREIWARLRERCRDGTCILFISSDLDELLQYSDRILVFFSGRVSPPVDASAATLDEIGGLIGGKGLSDLIASDRQRHV